MPFSSLGLAPALLRAVGELSYSQPTPVQAAAIPPILAGRDVLAMAQTGSGKTAAFGLPLLQAQFKTPAGPRVARALVLVPTRELVVQVGNALTALSSHMARRPKVAQLFGGVSINPQMMDLRGGADVVVATPGRLLDLVEHNALSLAAVSLLVLDEADRLLDLGFSDELARILALLPVRRQSLFFSATFPPAVAALADQLLADPVRVEVVPAPETAPDIAQRSIAVDVARRTQLLKHLLGTEKWRTALVFVATKYAADHVADKLQRNGISAGALHGDASQGARSQVLADFKSGHLQVLVATDVAARGIDIPLLPAVVNYDLPRSPDDYLHRIGRTGRAGERGTAVSFVSADTEAHFRLIEKRQGLQLERESIAGFEATAVAPAVPPGLTVTDTEHGGIKGKRKSKKDKLREAAAQQQED